MSPHNSRTVDSGRALALILGLFVGLAILYDANTPLYESPDELQHAAYVAWLADGQGLPVVRPENLGPWEQEGTQPPLYYRISATVAGWVPHEGASALAKPNPHTTLGDPLRPDNKNRMLHDFEQERWPYRGKAVFAHLARGVSALMAVGTLGAIYCLGRVALPDQPGIALGMTGLVAFTPQFLFVSTSINNDNLTVLLASWTLVLLAGWLRARARPTWVALAGLGVRLGLSALAKLSGLLLWPLAGGVMLWLAWRERRLHWLVLAGSFVLALAMVTCGWWSMRNHQLYGEWTGLGTHLPVIGTRPRGPASLEALWAEFRGFRYSFWALAGWFNILAPKPFYGILDGMTVLGTVGFGLLLARSWLQRPLWQCLVIVMLLVWLGLVAVVLLRWTRLTSASQGRLLYPALGAIALVLVAGWAELIPGHFHRPVSSMALIGWAVWAAVYPFLVIKPAFALPLRVQSLIELGFSPSEVHVRYGECRKPVGYVQPEAPVLPGDRIPMTLVWQALKPTEEDYELSIQATAADGQIVGQLDTYHGGGMYPTSQWRPGEVIADKVYVPIRRKAKGPTLVRFNVGLQGTQDRERLPAFGPDGQQLEVVFAGEAALAPFQWPVPRHDPQADALFGHRIQLVGINLPQVAVHPGELITVTLQWRRSIG